MARPSQHKRNPVQYVRLVTGMSQSRFAAELGISKSWLSKIECNQLPRRTGIPPLVTRLVQARFGAILCGPDAPCPAVDANGKPYNVEFFVGFRPRRAAARPEQYSPEAVGKAVRWVGDALTGLNYGDYLAAAETFLRRCLEAPGATEIVGEMIRAKLSQERLSLDEAKAVHLLADKLELSQPIKDALVAEGIWTDEKT